MPNYKLSGYIRNVITEEVKQICQRRVDYAQDGFPLTAEDVQNLCMSDEELYHLRAVEAMGVDGLPKDQDPTFLVTKLHGNPVKRDVVIHTFLPEPVFADTSFYCGGFPIRGKMPAKAYLRPERLEPTTVVALGEWVDRVVRERRLSELTQAVVAWMLNKHLPTTGHLLVRWPVLATLIPASEKEWKSRLRHPPVRFASHAWTNPLVGAEAQALKAAEAVLLGGSMLGAYTKDPSVVRGQVDHWERLETDKVFCS